MRSSLKRIVAVAALMWAMVLMPVLESSNKYSSPATFAAVEESRMTVTNPEGKGDMLQAFLYVEEDRMLFPPMAYLKARELLREFQDVESATLIVEGTEYFPQAMELYYSLPGGGKDQLAVMVPDEI